MNILSSLENFINEFNNNYNIEFSIDSIRIEFSKQHKLEKLKEIGNWRKINKNSNILHKLKKRLIEDEITSAHRLGSKNIYFFNSNSDKPQYRKAELVIFGMKQYHKEPPSRDIIIQILSILKNISNIDVCYDMEQKPNIKAIQNTFQVKQYISKDGIFTNTYYINETNIDMIEKITIYDKAYKNKLDSVLWRIEAKISIPNIKYLALPLSEFKEIVELAKC